MAFTLNNIASDKKNSSAKRGDLVRAHISKIIRKEGFNVRTQDDELREHVASIAGAIAAGLPIPALEVWVNPETGDIELVDGYCRHDGYVVYGLENPSFDGYVPVVEFKGTPLQRKMRIASSNKQLKLKPVELGKLYLEARDVFGASRQEIAAEAGMSLAHVDQHILLATGNQEIHAAVGAGSISATEAVKLIRDHGEDASAELERRMEEANKLGKGKVTAKSATPKPSRNSKDKSRLFVLYSVEAWYDSLDEGQRQAIESSEDQQSMLLADVLQCIKEMRECDKALDADKQMELIGGAE